jgi:hypothetical protein
MEWRQRTRVVPRHLGTSTSGNGDGRSDGHSRRRAGRQLAATAHAEPGAARTDQLSSRGRRRLSSLAYCSDFYSFVCVPWRRRKRAGGSDARAIHARVARGAGRAHPLRSGSLRAARRSPRRADRRTRTPCPAHGSARRAAIETQRNKTAAAAGLAGPRRAGTRRRVKTVRTSRPMRARTKSRLPLAYARERHCRVQVRPDARVVPLRERVVVPARVLEPRPRGRELRMEPACLFATLFVCLLLCLFVCRSAGDGRRSPQLSLDLPPAGSSRARAHARARANARMRCGARFRLPAVREGAQVQASAVGATGHVRRTTNNARTAPLLGAAPQRAAVATSAAPLQRAQRRCNERSAVATSATAGHRGAVATHAMVEPSLPPPSYDSTMASSKGDSRKPRYAARNGRG